MDRRRRAARTVALMSLFTMTDTQTDVPIASFDGDGSDLISLIVGIDPVQAGSGDPSPDNVRPISGWTEAKVTRTGKNLNPYEGVNYTAETHPNGIFLKAGTYIFSLDTGVAFGYNHAMYIKLKDENGNAITNGNISGDGWQLNGSGTYYYGCGDTNMPKPFNLLKDCYVCFGFNNQYPTDGNNVQLELGSTATAYEPYKGNTYTIAFPAEAGAVHDAALDVTNGKLTVSSNVYDTNPVSIQTLIGTNNIWADTGEIKYIEYNV